MTKNEGDDIGNLIEDVVRDNEADLIALRRDIHAHPELGFDTHRTAGVVARELSKLGLDPATGIGRTGVVAEILGAGDGPCLIIRADMDALPMEEETGLPYASKHPGKMHACGHDIHTATLIGVARVLRKLTPKLKGRVRLVFQPAEETAESGAKAMVADGAADGADLALGFHNRPEMAVGKFGYTRGVVMAAGDEFDITIRGVGGHAAWPHRAVDPIVAAAAMIMQLQTVVSRTIDPTNSTVLTVGHIRAGTTHNLIPDECLLQGTIRSFTPHSRKIMRDGLYRTVEGVSAAMGVSSTINFMQGVPCVVNDDKVLDTAIRALGEQFGDDSLVTGEPSYGSEDFAYFSERIPSCHLLIGACQPGRNDHVHQTTYQPDERSIAIGVAALSKVAVDLLA